jgi:hypothetical protein
MTCVLLKESGVLIAEIIGEFAVHPVIVFLATSIIVLALLLPSGFSTEILCIFQFLCVFPPV